jgi:hypothetical protein
MDLPMTFISFVRMQLICPVELTTVQTIRKKHWYVKYGLEKIVKNETLSGIEVIFNG